MSEVKQPGDPATPLESSPGQVQWTRFWCPPNEQYNLDDLGYLEDPETQIWWQGVQSNPKVRTFEAISGYPCLVLLGEPGIGKSKTLRFEYEKLQTESKLWWSLESCVNESQVEKFFSKQEIKDWTAGDFNLIVFIDALDEAVLSVQKLCQALVQALEELPVGRLHLRVACRTTQWPKYLNDNFQRLWKGNCHCQELLPLRRNDVAAAAKHFGVSPEPFLGKLESGRVVPLASKPVTLFFLLKRYQKGKNLSEGQADIYKQGCLKLAEETNESRKVSKLKGEFSPTERVRCARLIAIYTLFCGKSSIFLETDDGSAGEGDLLLDDFCQVTSLEPELVKEALDSGLFSSRGSHRVGWTHRSYAEYLAATWFWEKDWSLQRLLGLLAKGQADGIVPQLLECAAWIALQHDLLFEHLTEKHPEFLLSSNVNFVKPEQRKRLLKRTLEHFDALKLLDTPYERYFDKFQGPDIEQILGEQLQSLQSGSLALRAVFRIIGICKVNELQSQVLEKALDENNPLHVRENAVRALVEMAPPGSCENLKVFALGLKIDKDDQLKGMTLGVVWDLLSQAERWQALTPPQNDHLVGDYYMFLIRELPLKLKKADLKFAFPWLESTSHWENSLHRQIVKAMMGSVARMMSPEVAQMVGSLLATSLDQDWDSVDDLETLAILGDHILQDTESRRSFLSALAHDIEATFRIRWLRWRYDSTTAKADFQWLLAQLLEAPEERESAWLALLELAFDPEEQSQRDSLKKAKETRPNLKTFLNPKPSVSTNTKPHVQPQKAQPDLTQALAISEQFPAKRWRFVLSAIDPELAQDRECSIGDRKGWFELTDEEQDAVRTAASLFLQSYNPETESWWATGSLTLQMFQGLQALDLLFSSNKSFNISEEVWRKWLPVLVRLASFRDPKLPALLAYCQRTFPEQFRELVLERIALDATRVSFRPVIVRPLARLLRHWSS